MTSSCKLKINEFAAQGYTVARGLFALDEVQRLRQAFPDD